MPDVLGLPAGGALVNRRTTPDHVADVIREAILTGRLEDGVELNQVALAEHFAVSRVPVREALRQLQAEGLIRQEAHRRAVVTTLDADRIDELFDVRIRLEQYMLERAIANMSDPEVEGLAAQAAAMDELSDHDEWLQANREFHRALYEPSGATYTQDLAGQIAARTTRYLFQRSGGRGIEAHDEAHDEHLDIIAAVRRRDAEAACAALAHHIEGTRSRVHDFLRGRRDAVAPLDDQRS